ncbi:hypothetical protein ACFL0W_03830 [Nanoarchaeota archaeon]
MLSDAEKEKLKELSEFLEAEKTRLDELKKRVVPGLPPKSHCEEIAPGSTTGKVTITKAQVEEAIANVNSARDRMISLKSKYPETPTPGEKTVFEKAVLDFQEKWTTLTALTFQLALELNVLPEAEIKAAVGLDDPEKLKEIIDKIMAAII